MAALILMSLILLASCFTCPNLKLTVELNKANTTGSNYISSNDNLYYSYYAIKDTIPYSFPYLLSDVGIGLHVTHDEILDVRAVLIYEVDPDGSGTAIT